MSSLAGITAQPIRFHPPKTPLQYGVRETPGRFNRIRWAAVGLTQALFFGLCWASWQGRPLVGFDFSRQQIHLFGAILGPQDLFLLALLLIAGALALFAVSAIAGRLFCGFACPQSVYTAVFLWIEQRLQGSPGQRQRRAREGARVQTGLRRAATWGAWGAVSLWIGWTLVAYFSPAPDLWTRTLQADLGPWELFGMLFYGGFTFLQAGLLREKVCQHMCPYARFQGVMGNARTLNVSYDVPRGEPRARPTAQAADSTAGACIDCGLCVDVCPAGIDIRQGAQYECISCGLCIDACDRVMTRTRQPTGLIRFASLGGDRLGDVLRQPRIRVYGALLLAALLGVGLIAWQRIPLQLEVTRDRSVMARVDRQGGVENLYRLHLQNYDTAAHDYAVTVSGLPGLRVDTPRDTRIASGEGRTLVVSVKAPAQDIAQNVAPGIAPLQFTVRASGDNRQQRTRASTFLFPH
jgi:cytochrome c oxidase accessory protein FixG